jgi:hypothetical protein
MLNYESVLDLVYIVLSMLNSEHVLDQFTIQSMLNPKKDFCRTSMLNSAKGEALDSGRGKQVLSESKYCNTLAVP